MADDDIIDRIGLNIRIIRERRGLTQEKLAELSGLHRAYIGQIERGEKNIGLRNLEKIAKALNIKIQVLVNERFLNKKKPHQKNGRASRNVYG